MESNTERVPNGSGNEDGWWHVMGVLYKWKRFIFFTSGLVALITVVISLMLPNWYRASSRLLLPEGSSSGLASAMLGNLSSAAASLIGGSGGDYVRYMVILGSRRVLHSAVDSFDLVAVYQLEEEEFPVESAVSSLREYVEVSIDDEFEFLSVSVMDKDPVRAAEIANFFVRALDRVENELSSQTAGLYRQYVEERFDESRRSRNIVLDSLRAFHEKYGIISLEAQAQAYFSQMAEFRGMAVQAEIQFETLRSQYGSNNPRVRTAKNVLDAAKQIIEESLAGNERIFPVSVSDTPQMVRQYLALVMEQTIQEKILEFVAPMLEQARFEEQKQFEALQIVDRAVPPVKKYKPRRMIIVIASTLSAFILAVIFSLMLNWWRTNHRYFYRRLDEASRAASHMRT